MTFDARGGEKSSGGNTLVFGAITLTVVAGAFFAVLNLPHSANHAAPGSAHTLARMQDAATTTKMEYPEFSGKSARSFLSALSRVDPAARANLDRRLAKADAYDHTKIAIEEAGKVLARHKSDLAKADMRHVDDWLDMTRSQLKSASRSKHRWCAGSRYQDFNTASGLSGQMAAASDLADLGSELTDYSFASISIALVAIEDAQTRPVKHGNLTARDEAALQGVAMSLMSDPQIMPLLLASGPEGPSKSALASLDMCQLGATAVTALKTLPQGTKGRAFAEMVRSADFSGGDLSQLKNLSSF
ncbi:hypothetical protein [uncultured Hyphomonas sp.]|uniref:hypothetical protein n=1 Tax=uncultured Hyphomonas sp. TaxID=225298 RepID=UPI0026158759|nr:hypothetical protein [uncultured Hyphomonas sp.]